MNRFCSLVLLLSLGAFGCGDDDSSTPDATPPTPMDDAMPPMGDAMPPMSDARPPMGDARPPMGDAMPPMMIGCPGETTIEFDTAVMGDTSMDGWDEDISGWFDNSDVACTTSGRDYPAPYAVYSLPMPAGSDWDITVTGASGRPGVDVSLVAWTQSATDLSCYPTRGVGVVSCEAANSGGPGRMGSETVRMTATTNPYHLVILVSSPSTATSGSFTLRVTDHAG